MAATDRLLESGDVGLEHFEHVPAEEAREAHPPPQPIAASRVDDDGLPWMACAASICARRVRRSRCESRPSRLLPRPLVERLLGKHPVHVELYRWNAPLGGTKTRGEKRQTVCEQLGAAATRNRRYSDFTYWCTVAWLTSSRAATCFALSCPSPEPRPGPSAPHEFWGRRP